MKNMGIIPEGCQLEEISGENEMKLLKRSKQTDILKGIAIILILTTHFHYRNGSSCVYGIVWLYMVSFL